MINHKKKYYKYCNKINLFIGGSLCELPVIKTINHQDCWIDTVIYAFLSNLQLCDFLMSQWYSIVQQNTNNPLYKMINIFELIIRQLYDSNNTTKILNYDRIKFGMYYLKEYLEYLSIKKMINSREMKFMIETIKPLDKSLNKGDYEGFLFIMLKEINDKISVINDEKIEKIKTINDPKNCIIFFNMYYITTSPVILSQIENIVHENGDTYLLVSGIIGANREPPQDHVISFFRCESDYYLFDNKLDNLIKLNKEENFAYSGGVFKTPLEIQESSIFLFYMKI
jgi:hypothetical protein